MSSGEMAEKAIFLDRDNTLIVDPGYINNPNQVKLIAGVPGALSELKAMGYKLVVATNQSGVARGIVSEKTLGEIHERMERLLSKNGAYIDRIYYCPYHVDGVIDKYRKDSDWRKPNPGMLLAAAREMDIELEQSWFIGNSDSDVEAGRRAGCKTILINHPAPYKKITASRIKPDYSAVNIKEAVNIIKKYLRSSPKADEQPETASQSQESKLPLSLEQSQPSPDISDNKTISGKRMENLLSGILDQLKSSHRTESFKDFSLMRLLAGTIQVLAIFCLLICIGLLMIPGTEHSSVFIVLGFGAVLQMMALTFYMMQGRK